MAEPLLRARNIYKEFPGVVAVDHVDLEVSGGEVLALIGENGAGKSTMMKILSGAYQCDGGVIEIQGRQVELTSPKQALDLGISIIYQELNYLNSLSIAENILLGQLPEKGKSGLVDHAMLKHRSMDIQKLVGLDYLDPGTLLEEISIGEKQLVEIAKAYAKNVKVLIMDEPTSALNIAETEKLFNLIGMAKSQGLGVIYISHKLDEVMTVADRIQVMRDGKSVNMFNKAHVTRDELVTAMVGREISEMYPINMRPIVDVVLEADKLCTGFLENISFSLHKGEILGLYGLMGSGCDDVLECLFGKQRLNSGSILIDGKKANIASPRDAVKYGIAYVPSERKTEGLILKQSVKENITLSSLHDFEKPLRIDTRKERETAQDWAEKLSVKTPTIDTLVETLSGGNQQKVILAKWMLTNPKVLLLNDPTRGIDVGAKVEIYKLMEAFCRQGLGVIFLSSEMGEVIYIADRTIVIENGRIGGEYTKSEITQEKIMRSAIGA